MPWCHGPCGVAGTLFTQRAANRGTATNRPRQGATLARRDEADNTPERTMTRKVLLSWSSGKDSAWALQVLRGDPRVQLVGLLTTINRHASRVAMHAVRESLLEAQAAAVGLPLTKIYLPYPCSNEEYEEAMASTVEQARAAGVTSIAFGDLFLEEVRRYREDKLAPMGIEPLFPLWGSDTSALSREIVKSGLRAIVTCVDPKRLSTTFVGRIYDTSFLDDLPAGVDPCGERGEFHSFAYAGPMFDQALRVSRGETVERDGFVFADVLPSGPGRGSQPSA